jgi:hypothetical protein
MAATVESVIHQPATKPHRHRGVFALAAGLVMAGALAATVVLADDSDGPSPAPRVQVTTKAPIEDPLIVRFGTQSSAPPTAAKAGTEADLRLAAEWARRVEGLASYTDLRLAAEWARRLEALGTASAQETSGGH